MNRRGFLGLLAGAIGGMSLDPERALWLPGKKLISIPRAGNQNRLLTLDEIARETLRILQANLEASLAMQRTLNRMFSERIEVHTVGARLSVRGPIRTPFHRSSVAS